MHASSFLLSPQPCLSLSPSWSPRNLPSSPAPRPPVYGLHTPRHETLDHGLSTPRHEVPTDSLHTPRHEGLVYGLPSFGHGIPVYGLQTPESPVTSDCGLYTPRMHARSCDLNSASPDPKSHLNTLQSSLSCTLTRAVEDFHVWRPVDYTSLLETCLERDTRSDSVTSEDDSSTGGSTPSQRPASSCRKPRKAGARRTRKVCDICGKSYAHRATLRAHKRDFHGGDLHVCMICNTTFSSSRSLSNHKKTHVTKKMHPCPVDTCQNVFSDRSTLAKHLRTHTGARPYSCSICGKSFAQSGNMLRHQRQVHSDL